MEEGRKKKRVLRALPVGWCRQCVGTLVKGCRSVSALPKLVAVCGDRCVDIAIAVAVAVAVLVVVAVVTLVAGDV